MKCPKCGSENIGEYMNDGCQVGDTLICCEAGCNHVFSEGQQAEIEQLLEEKAEEKLKAMRLQSMLDDLTDGSITLQERVAINSNLQRENVTLRARLKRIVQGDSCNECKRVAKIGLKVVEDGFGMRHSCEAAIARGDE